MALMGNNSRLIYGGSTFGAKLLSVNGWDMTRAEIDTTTLATTTARTSTPSSLYDPGSLDITVEYDGQANILTSTAETLTLHFGSTSTNAPTWAGTGYCISQSPSIGDEARVTLDMTMRFSGAITFTTA